MQGMRVRISILVLLSFLSAEIPVGWCLLWKGRMWSKRAACHVSNCHLSFLFGHLKIL
jgi:hypothetical protein